MRKRVPDILLELRLRAAVLAPWALLPAPSSFRRRPGQNTVEYLMMLAVVASMAVIMLIMFHKKILGGIFTLAGMVIGAGTPK